MEIEQRYVISFLIRKGLKTKDIILELQQTYKDDAYSKTTVYYWVNEIKLGRIDLNNIPSPGRPVDSFIDQFILKELDVNPRISARSLAKKAKVSKTMIIDHLHNSLGMKNVHLKWIPHFLNMEQKNLRVTFSKALLNHLITDRKNGFKFIFTGDESWFGYVYSVKQMWVIDTEDRDEIVENSILLKKLMITIFINGESLQFLDVKPKDIKITSEYFIHNILEPMELNDVVLEAKSLNIKTKVHFDNAPSHNSHSVENYLVTSPFERLDHPPYSPDLAICDFGLFGTIKDSFADQEFEDENELLQAVEHFFEEKKEDFFNSLFEEWIKRLNKCIQLNGDYVE